MRVAHLLSMHDHNFFLLNMRVGFFLAIRQLRRSSFWTTGLTVFVMLLTFLNLVVVTGILVGLVEGINDTYRTQYVGDVAISALPTKNYIDNSAAVLMFVRSLPQVDALSARYQRGGRIEANYKNRTDFNEKSNETGVQIMGINPVSEDDLTHLSSRILEGSYLSPTDYDQILIGSELLDRYSFGEQPGQQLLRDVYPGTKVRVTLGDIQREVTVKGIIKSKVGEIGLGAFMVDTQLRTLIGRNDYNVSSIAIRLKEGTDPVAFATLLKQSDISRYAKVQTFEEAIPSGVGDIKDTFAQLGNGISSIGLVVASVTIFIVIFINAITRRKFIGILKGIGVSGRAIEISYMIQSLFYALCGSAIGLVIIYFFLVPYVAAHPIDFPFSDGILVAPVVGTLVRVGLLVVATVIAGYIPARMIVKKNTLDSILGRN